MSELAIASTENPSRSSWADMAGMIASIGCAIHCAAMPLVLAYLPAFGLSWLADEGFHQWMAAVCFALAAAAFVPGWRKHGSLTPVTLGAAGVLLLSTAAFGMECDCCPSDAPQQSTTSQSTTFQNSKSLSSEVSCEDEACEFCATQSVTAESVPEPGNSFAWLTPFVTPLGGLLLVAGHVANHRKSCSCRGDVCCLETDHAEQAHAPGR